MQTCKLKRAPNISQQHDRVVKSFSWKTDSAWDGTTLFPGRREEAARRNEKACNGRDDSTEA